ncbi:PilZ domain-containing protein [Undibacterium sp. RTI2.1]|uniref:PilZ domain-containing protein n=1 Tax=unclassified Undibacterium TaxID=2630295 RepID=UPI002AB4B79D|nr:MULTISPECIES: PilZ domain-containing protein [unclassified Undibacterium]MDY7537784.1 PilZ domain-containing protein [Undibacterium sp. 5I1]MEB0030528.1 PilZ domain-containing protein [Undibacterium sp. RTI2.1]MEB0116972.1 PilZ domain-containing protein [Undibacterium sp. RTI2.2]MEB0229901.1 PilZ domain-containing protein [Undibacterium sp. 10I3]MEB0257634.1 PilZ domain-containing protein [Undibacterium sp. 5I1]
MIELRKSPRVNVTWRAVIKLANGQLMPAKIVNISTGGVLLQCPEKLEVNAEYQIMMEVPSIDFAKKEQFKVPCKAHIQHIILTGDFYRVGVKFSELSDLHQRLLDAWISKSTVSDQSN